MLVVGDATRLEQVVRNLLDNALKYTPPGGQVELTVARDGDEMRMRVRDTGVGIAPEILPHIFELFVQAQRSLDRADGGLGLGLTLVRRLVQMHGGTVSASSDGSTQGSEFEVRIPVAETTERVGPASPSPASPTSRRVLVVEDNPDARETLVLLLESWGHWVAQAEDGEAAVALAARETLDVALIDVGLPRMDGYAVARALRAIPACRQLRLVALTGYSREEDRRLAHESGFDAYLVKPVDPDALQRRPERAARLEKGIDEIRQASCTLLARRWRSGPAGPGARRRFEGEETMSLILLVILVLLVVGALPAWPYSSGWGYGPSGVLGLVLVVIIVLALTGRL